MQDNIVPYNDKWYNMLDKNGKCFLFSADILCMKVTGSHVICKDAFETK